MLKLNLNFNKKEKVLKKDNYQLNADFFWKIILYTSFLIILCALVFGFVLFTKTSEGLDLKPEFSSGGTVVVKKERIQKTLEIFSERKNKSMKIINFPSSVVDPSL